MLGSKALLESSARYNLTHSPDNGPIDTILKKKISKLTGNFQVSSTTFPVSLLEIFLTEFFQYHVNRTNVAWDDL